MSLIPSGTRAAIVSCLVFVFVALALPVAQQPPPTFRTGVEAVVLDVSVLDKDRRPVRGLTAADFTILEDGKPHDIRTFKAIDMEDVVETLPAPWLREVAPHPRAAGRQPPLVFGGREIYNRQQMEANRLCDCATRCSACGKTKLALEDPNGGRPHQREFQAGRS